MHALCLAANQGKSDTGEEGAVGAEDAYPIGGRIRCGTGGDSWPDVIGRTLLTFPITASWNATAKTAAWNWWTQAQRHAPDLQQSGDLSPDFPDVASAEVSAVGALELIECMPEWCSAQGRSATALGLAMDLKIVLAGVA